MSAIDLNTSSSSSAGRISDSPGVDPVNRKRKQRKTKEKISQVYVAFDLVPTKIDGVVKAICKHCRKTLSYNSSKIRKITVSTKKNAASNKILFQKQLQIC